MTFFAKNYVLIYGAALPIVALLAWIGAKRAPILLIAAVALAMQESARTGRPVDVPPERPPAGP